MPLSQPIRTKTKTNHGLHVFDFSYVFGLSSDWFIALFASVVIGQSYNFGFGFTTLK